MSREIYVISDTHFGHRNIIRYCNRPFVDEQEMSDIMVERWNAVVRPNDIVYHLGDVYFGAANALYPTVLNGRKRLILGNHDDGKDPALHRAFQKIMVWRMWPEFGLLFTHVPVHADGLKHHDLINVHGHIHERLILGEDGLPDERYANVSVEQTNYMPVNIETLRVR
ncbi:hypothetical protein ACUN0C_18940 [Faunimonas sp. B44]|uniref:hypothetical protein n=1 Tax=Faunimonas sp. B44 TaxID=3461493 RepID=UPI004043E8BE